MVIIKKTKPKHTTWCAVLRTYVEERKGPPLKRHPGRGLSYAAIY